MEMPDFMIWVKEEPFLFGQVTPTPCNRIGTNLLRKVAEYCRDKEGYYPKLTLLQWGHICRYKLQLQTDLSWLYLRTYDILSKRFEDVPENSGSNGDHKPNDYWDKRCEEIRQCSVDSFNDLQVDTLEFLAFMYLQHYPRLHKKFFTRSAQSSDEPWPSNQPAGSPGGTSPSQRPSGSPKSGTRRKAIPEQVHTEFLESNIGDIVDLLKLSVVKCTSMDDDTIPLEVIKALSFILGSASNSHDREFGSLEECFALPEVAHALEFKKSCGTLSKSKFIEWVKANLKMNPWGPSSTPIPQVRANYLSGVWDKSKPHEVNRVYWNSQVPPKSWYLISSVDNQVFFLDKVKPFSSLKVHRCNNSYIYAPGTFSSIIVEKCQNSTIFLGPAGKIVRISECDSISITAVGRIFNLCDNSRSTFHLLTPCQPVVSGTKNRKLYFGPYNSFYPRLLEDMKPLELGVQLQKWNKPIELGLNGIPLQKDQQQGGLSLVHCNILRSDKFKELVFPFETNEGCTTGNPVELPPNYAKTLGALESKQQMFKSIVASKNLSEDKMKEFRAIVNVRFQGWLKEQGHYDYLQGLRSIQDSIRLGSGVPISDKRKKSSVSGLRSPIGPVENSSGGEGPAGNNPTGDDFQTPRKKEEVHLSTASWLSRLSSSNDARRRLSTSLEFMDDDVFTTPLEPDNFEKLDSVFFSDEGESDEFDDEESGEQRPGETQQIMVKQLEDIVMKFDDGSMWKPI